MSAKFFKSEGVPLIRGSNLSQDVDRRLVEDDFVFVSDDKADEFPRAVARRGDLIFTCWGTIGQVGLIDHRSRFERYLISNKQMKLSPDPAKADSLFLYYLFSAPELQATIQSAGIGSSVPGFNLGNLRSLKFHLPSLPEQKRIARILGTLDDKIELNRRMNATLEAMARALFQSWFVDFDPVRAKAAGQTPAGMDKPTADLFPAGFEDSEFGEIPTGWAKRRADEFSRVTIGKTPPRKEPQWFSESEVDVPWVSIRDLGTSGTYVSQTSERLTKKGIDRFNVRVVPRNTVILSFKLTVGRVAITDVELATNEAIAHFWIDPASGVTTEFLYLSLLAFDFDSLGSTSSIATAVNSDSVRSIEICIPPAALIEAFTAIVRPMFAMIRSTQAGIRTLAETRDALLPRLLSGEMDSSGMGE